MENQPTTTDRVRGLDSIRFICALWVFFGHGAAPTLANPLAEGSTGNLVLRGIYNNIWVGPAAVIVFFVISGFCIHFPFAGSDRSPRLKEFYSRRFIRLLAPIAIAIPLSGIVGVRLSLFQHTILWSLLAESIYYLCYPALRHRQLRLGSWRGIILVSFIAALLVAATNPNAGNYPSYGPALNWILGLPCWLLGCVLADYARTTTARRVPASSIWTCRATVLSAAWICSVLRFHSPIGFPWTLNLFAVLVVFWLQREIQFRKHVAQSRVLEWAGEWSYSLYLIHPLAGLLFAKLFRSLPKDSLRWAFMVLFVFTACYLFYWLVERPSHALARITAQKLRLPHPNSIPVFATSTDKA